MRLKLGQRVRTVRPEQESADWAAGTRSERKWGAFGRVVTVSDAHGVCYEVRHEDGSSGWYEHRELEARP